MKELLKKIKDAALKAGASEVIGRESTPIKDAPKTLDVKVIFQRKPLKKGEKPSFTPPLGLIPTAQDIAKAAGINFNGVTAYPAYQDPCFWLINVSPVISKPETSKPRT